jgi:integrase
MNCLLAEKAAPPATAEEAVARFLRERRARGLAEATLRNNEMTLRTFFERYPQAWGPRFRECALEHLAEARCPATYNARLKALSLFVGELRRMGALDCDLLEGLRYRHEEPRVVELSREALRRLLDVPDRRTYQGALDCALVLLQLDCTIRPGEALALRRQDIDLTEHSLLIRPATAKTRRWRKLFFSAATGEALRALLSLRPKGWSDQVPVFATRKGTPLMTSVWSRHLRRMGRRIGLPRLSAYDLRHAGALEFLRAGGDALLLQQQMGHSTLAMTRHYLALSDEDLRRAHRLASPVAALLGGSGDHAAKP